MSMRCRTHGCGGGGRPHSCCHTCGHGGGALGGTCHPPTHMADGGGRHAQDVVMAQATTCHDYPVAWCAAAWRLCGTLSCTRQSHGRKPNGSLFLNMPACCWRETFKARQGMCTILCSFLRAHNSDNTRPCAHLHTPLSLKPITCTLDSPGSLGPLPTACPG